MNPGDIAVEERHINQIVSDAKSVPAVRQIVDNLLVEWRLNADAMEELKRQTFLACRSLIEEMNVDMLAASIYGSADEGRHVFQRLDQARVALIDWRIFSPEEVEDLMRTSSRLAKGQVQHDRQDLLEVANAYISSCDFAAFLQHLKAVKTDHSEAWAADWLQSLASVHPSEPVRLSEMKEVATSLRRLLPSPFDEKAAFRGVTELVVNCDPAWLLLPEVTSLVLKGAWHYGSLDVVLQDWLPGVRELTIEDCHIELVLKSTLKKIRVINLTSQNINRHVKLRDSKNSDVVLRGYFDGYQIETFESPHFFCREFRQVVDIPRHARSLEATRQGKQIANADFLRKFLSASKNFWTLPFDAPQAAFDLFTHVFVMKQRILDGWQRNSDNCVFIKSKNETVAVGFRNRQKLATMETSAREAFEAVVAVHCRRLADDDVVYAELDDAAQTSGDLEMVSVEAVYPALQMESGQMTRRWILPESRMVFFRQELYDSHVDFRGDMAWFRKRNPN